ncbi:MAG: polysaccharide deacetylase family protein [Cyanobacteria bacterium]|nr:polysaccharide deacetylase family protein [Cyanobacteriota bacterium]
MNQTLQVKKLELLSTIGKKLLPRGYWHNPNSHSEDNAACHLTFDDGPLPETTPRLLDMLADFKIKATFFFTGRNARRYPDLVKRAAKEGHEIGNHSTNHLPLWMASASFIQGEIDDTSRTILQLTGSNPVVFRPPYGLIDDRGAKIVESRDMKLVYWGTLAEDWSNIGSEEVALRTIRQLRQGSLIVLHEHSRFPDQCIDATQRILSHSNEKGLRYGTITSDSVA